MHPLCISLQLPCGQYVNHSSLHWFLLTVVVRVVSQHLVTVVLHAVLEKQGEDNVDVDVGLEDSGCDVGQRWAQGKLHSHSLSPATKPTHPRKNQLCSPLLSHWCTL